MTYFEHVAHCVALVAKPMSYRSFLILRDAIQGV